MKKLILTFSLFLVTITIAAQEAETSKDGWTKSGNISFLLNQSTFENWLAGGQNNLAGTVGINYDFNLLKGDWTWDNKIMGSYGLTKVEGSEFTKKTDDRLEFNSLVGKKASGLWSYSFFLNFRTQFAKGYEFGEDVNGDETRTETTNFLSPGYLQLGPGMLWKKSDNLKVNIAPATAKLVFVDKDFTLPDDAYFGVEEGKSTRFEFGFNLSGYYKANLMTNVSMENILSVYSNYLEDPQNVDLDYQMNLVLQVNKYLSTNFSFQTIYDDNAFKGFQVRQVIGLGVNYGF